MDENIKKIYEMMYSPIITPYNLLQNAKISVYNYVKYYKGNEGLIAEMQCDIPDEGLKTFFYHFDAKDYLEEIFVEYDNKRIKLFDRKDEVNKAKQEYYQNKQQLRNAI